jgi:hypothetical protein
MVADPTHEFAGAKVSTFEVFAAHWATRFLPPLVPFGFSPDRVIKG